MAASRTAVAKEGAGADASSKGTEMGADVPLENAVLERYLLSGMGIEGGAAVLGCQETHVLDKESRTAWSTVQFGAYHNDVRRGALEDAGRCAARVHIAKNGKRSEPGKVHRTS